MSQREGQLRALALILVVVVSIIYQPQVPWNLVILYVSVLIITTPVYSRIFTSSISQISH
jgi:hypothetical protein